MTSWRLQGVSRRRFSEELGETMRGMDVAKLDPKEMLQTRGW